MEMAKQKSVVFPLNLHIWWEVFQVLQYNFMVSLF